MINKLQKENLTAQVMGFAYGVCHVGTFIAVFLYYTDVFE